MSQYLRDDLILCTCCYKFYDRKTLKETEVAYSEMPAEFATSLKAMRKKVAGKQHADRMWNRKKKKT